MIFREKIMEQLKYRGKDPELRQAQRTLLFSQFSDFEDSKPSIAEAVHVSNKLNEIPDYLRDEPPAHAQVFPAYPKTLSTQLKDKLSEVFNKTYDGVTSIAKAFNNSSKIINEFYHSLQDEDKQFINHMAKSIGGHHLSRFAISAFGFSSPVNFVLFTLLLNAGMTKAFKPSNRTSFVFIDGYPKNGTDLCNKTDDSLTILCQQFYVLYKDSLFCQAVEKYILTDSGDCTGDPSLWKCTPDISQFKNLFHSYLGNTNINVNDSLSSVHSSTVFSYPYFPYIDGYCAEDLNPAAIKTFIQLLGISPSSKLSKEIQQQILRVTDNGIDLSCTAPDTRDPWAVAIPVLGTFAGLLGVALICWIRCMVKRHSETSVLREPSSTPKPETIESITAFIEQGIRALEPDFSKDHKETKESKITIDTQYQEILKKIKDSKNLPKKLAEEFRINAMLAYYSWDIGTQASESLESRIKSLKKIIKTELNSTPKSPVIDANIKKKFLSLLARICIDSGCINFDSDSAKILQKYYLLAYTSALHCKEEQTAALALRLAFNSAQDVVASAGLDRNEIERGLATQEIELRKTKRKGNFQILLDAYKSNCKELGLEPGVELEKLLQQVAQAAQHAPSARGLSDASSLSGIKIPLGLDQDDDKTDTHRVTIHIDVKKL